MSCRYTFVVPMMGMFIVSNDIWADCYRIEQIAAAGTQQVEQIPFGKDDRPHQFTPEFACKMLDDFLKRNFE